MERSYFPEDKDLAHKIMMDLSNADLVKLCVTNKRMYEVCNNYPSFWRNKFVKDYGEHAAQYKPDNRTWKNHYMTVFIDLQKYKKNPTSFFINIAWKEDVDHSFFVDYDNKKLVPLKDAPEWVMNNLYLSYMNKVVIVSNTIPIEYENIKFIEILQKQPPSAEKYLQGFYHSLSGSHIQPRYTSLLQLRNTL